MKNLKFLILIFVISSILNSCRKEEDPFQTFLAIKNNTDKNIICCYYTGLNKDFKISAKYAFAEFPQTICLVKENGTMFVDCFISYDGKERVRTYQFIFFDGETLGKYTLSEIAELNIYDDLQILTLDELLAADNAVTYSGPKINK